MDVQEGNGQQRYQILRYARACVGGGGGGEGRENGLATERVRRRLSLIHVSFTKISERHSNEKF